LSSKHHVVLLPGLDGTGDLFFPIHPYLEKQFDIHIIKYSHESTFVQCVDSAEKQIPADVPVSLIAESFSGPVALALLSRKKFDYRASVLSATFTKTPLPWLTKIAKYLPNSLLCNSILNRKVIDIFATDDKTNNKVKSMSYKLLDIVSPADFKARINIINETDVSDQLGMIDMPLLYIQAINDRVVPARMGLEMRYGNKNITLTRVEGPHMILQSRPEVCADIITAFLSSNV